MELQTKPLTVILGFGAVGRATTELLLARGDAVCVAQRTRPADLPEHAFFRPCDVLDATAVRSVVEGASQVLLAIGITYDARVWRSVWPQAMRNVVQACAAIQARVIFIDNLYQLGPQTEPRHEEMALTNTGDKPAILAQVTRIWMAAARDHQLRFAALRCTDFYGPGVPVSHLGASAFGEMVKGRAAQMVVPLDTPHDFAYVPDIARAVVTLLDAPDNAFGHIWNMPCAPTRTPREILQLGANALGLRLKVMAIPLWLLPALGLFSRFMKEVVDVGFTWDRPYHVNAKKFTSRFHFQPTPFEQSAAQTAYAFQSVFKSCGEAAVGK